MVLGSDSIFHFNRFYDTSEQIKNINFQYFISIYGLQSSGRIVNALYGPFLAYIHGFLVLISKNWFVYQLLSNFLLFILAGISMYFLILKARIEKIYAFTASVLYISTFSIQYWTTRQGFTSWGAALLPLAFSLLFELEENARIPKYKLGIYTALILQTHILSSLIIILVYIPFFTNAFFKTDKKVRFFRELVAEILLFFLLTMNIWGSYFSIISQNDLVRPFINQTMYLNTINNNSYYWLTNPLTLIPIFIAVYFVVFKHWKQLETSKKLWFLVMNFFLLLSTSIFPWKLLIKQKNAFAQLIQFPFRFFVPVSIIIIYLLIYFINIKKLFNKRSKLAISFLICVSVIQPTILIAVTTNDWKSDNHFMPSKYKVIFNEVPSKIKSSFFRSNKKEALDLVEKGTPDYLPIYNTNKSQFNNFYDLYITRVIKNNNFKKEVKNDQLSIEWMADSSDFIDVPVVIYDKTTIIHNGDTLNHEQIILSDIGTPTIKQEKNKKNVLTISYCEGISESVTLYISIISWTTVILLSIKSLTINIKRYLQS